MNFLNPFRRAVAAPPTACQTAVLAALAGPVLPEEDWFHEALADLNSATSIRGYHASECTVSFTIAELSPEGPMEIGTGQIELVAAPLPAAELADACPRSWRWREAAAALSRQTHHWVLSVATETPPYPNALVAGRLLAVLSRLPEFLGAYFSGPGLVHSPEFLRENCDVEPDASPVDLWVNISLQGHEDGMTTLRTEGLEAFGVREIEIVRTRVPYVDLFERGQAFASHVMKAGPVLRDGDIVASTTGEELVVRHGPSVYDAAQTICRIHL